MTWPHTRRFQLDENSITEDEMCADVWTRAYFPAPEALSVRSQWAVEVIQ